LSSEEIRDNRKSYLLSYLVDVISRTSTLTDLISTAGNIAVENSCWRVVESENAGDAIRSGSGLGFVLKRLGTRWWGRRTQTQGVDAETQRRRDRSRREKPTGLLKRLENLRRTKKVPQADDVAVSWGNVDSGEVKRVLKAE